MTRKTKAQLLQKFLEFATNPDQSHKLLDSRRNEIIAAFMNKQTVIKAARPKPLTEVEKLQQILNDNGARHITVIDKDTVSARVDGSEETFSRGDTYSGSGSGMAFFGNISGDHRMIRMIAEDIIEVFSLMK